MTTDALLASLPAASGGFLLFDPEALLPALGPWALAGISLMIFIESGVLFPFLPGDSLLFTAGLLHEPLGLEVWVIALCAFVAAFLGDQVGFFLGHTFGRRWFRPDARVLKTAHLEKAEAFFARYGGVSLILGRFVPIVRTYVPLAAGTAGYTYRKFVVFNVVGAFLWAVGMVVLGSLLGGVPIIRDHVDVWAIVLVVVSVMPIVVTVLRKALVGRRDRAAAAKGL
ncbi:DedA family protein [Frigoribacterium sp. NBH87]|uniref:DedA family protein n=1 Tax=Frigoribacterium sp. NBH87 TaxID=2596916 RepID=UPI002102941B|nr:VTT domain-containing protein [Frigoribacterium sp. NBH87]